MIAALTGVLEKVSFEGGLVKMKTDLKTLKKELLKLTDTDYLKTELNKITSEIKDYNSKLSPKAKQRLKTVEGRFNDIRKRVVVVQKQVDNEVNKIMQIVRKTMGDTETRLNVRFPGTKKKAGKKTSKKTKKPARKKAST